MLPARPRARPLRAQDHRPGPTLGGNGRGASGRKPLTPESGLGSPLPGWLLGFLQHCLVGQLDLAAVIHGDHLDVNGVAHLDDLIHALDETLCQF